MHCTSSLHSIRGFDLIAKTLGNWSDRHITKPNDLYLRSVNMAANNSPLPLECQEAIQWKVQKTDRVRHPFAPY